VAELEQAKEDAENELRVKEDLVNQLESSKQEYVDLQQHQERMADHIRSLEDKVRACVDHRSPSSVASFGGPRPLCPLWTPSSSHYSSLRRFPRWSRRKAVWRPSKRN
jgi:hypothetical protein